MLSEVRDIADGRIVVVVVGVLAVLLILRVVARRAGRPARGEVWFAEVPFADGNGSKDRPVLVLAVRGNRCTVARLTSQDRGARQDHRRAPGVIPGLHGTSWVDLRPITLRPRAFRRRVTRPDPALLLWFERESGQCAAA